MSVGFGLSCPSSTHCVAVGIGALTTTDAGASWLEHPVPGELNVVSCPSVSQCVSEEDVTSAVPSHESTTLATSQDGGSTWSDVERVGGDVGVLGALSCPSPSHCVAVGNGYLPSTSSEEPLWGAVETTSDGGGTWTRSRQNDASDLLAVSCVPGTTDCLAGGYVAAPGGTSLASGTSAVLLRSVDDGTTWSEEPLP